jgi:DNA-binding transcriptional ArsR family regulator
MPHLDVRGLGAIVNHMVKYSAALLDRTFSAVSDPTRRDILDRLARGPASISELAQPLGISLPGLMKHVRILEEAALVKTTKNGRTRQCSLGPARLDEAAQWIERYREQWDRRIDRLETYISEKKRGEGR